MKKTATLISVLLITTTLFSQTWTAVNAGLPALTARGLVKLGDTLLVGIRGSGIYYTLDNGNSWQEHHLSYAVNNAGLNKFYGANAAMGADAFFFALGEGNVQYYELNNGFYSLGALVSELSDNQILSYEKAENPGTHFFGTLGGVFSFADAQGSPMVTATGLSGDALTVNSVFDNEDSQILAGTNAGLYVSNDNGASFSVDESSIPSSVMVNEIGAFTLTSNGVYFLQQQGPAFIPIVQGGDYLCSYWDMMGSGNAYFFGDNVGTIMDGDFNATTVDVSAVTGGRIVSTVVMGEYVFVCTESGGVFRYGNNSVEVAPVAPTNLAATAFKTQTNYIELSWTDNANNEDGFTLERSTDNQNFTAIGSLAADVISFQDNSLTPSTTYYYRAFAFNAVGNSSYSNVVEITTDATVGLSEANQSGVRFFPNPAKDILTLTVTERKQVEISDLSGRKVLQAEVSAENKTINITNLPSGTYFVAVNGQTQRIVKL